MTDSAEDDGMDGLELYCDTYLKIRFKASLLQKIRHLESLARHPARNGTTLLLELESFLTATSEDPTDFVGYRRDLSNQDIARRFNSFHAAHSDRSKLQILKTLTLDAEIYSLGALRSLTALGRLMDPMEWGTLNWRVLACAGFESMTDMKNRRVGQSRQQVEAEFLHMSEADVFRYLEFIRRQIRPEMPDLPRVVGALYCLSLELWPLEIPIEKQTSLPIFQHVQDRGIQAEQKIDLL